ncbi:MAG: diguanylate cyclase, partial [Alphaproteobacteria bacterium]|nr:diguanylate cyclase [Alphaproteobacteria bacterium]
LILSKLQYDSRGVSILDAHSSREAMEVLGREEDMAVVLLDVVMETDDAGLRLVHHIRKDLDNRFVRIILRTGQPGQAPEEKVIIDYDINDYKEKTELTSQKLTTTVISALRSYHDIMAVETSRTGLQRIIDTSNSLFKLRRFDDFARGTIETFGSFVNDTRGAVLVQRRGQAPPSFVCGIGGYDEGVGDALPRLMEALDRKAHCHGDDVALYLPVEDDLEMAVFLRRGRRLSGIEQSLLETLASKIAVGFSSVHHYELLREANEHLEARVAERTQALKLANLELEQLATLDALTGAFNRRHFDELVSREIMRARRLGRRFALLMIDIDHFKAFNDTYGHAAGDLALQTMIRECSGELRDIDVICRYGGEEFVVLLPETTVTEAVLVAERLREKIAALSLCGGDRDFQMTASFGVAEWRLDEDFLGVALARADAALYAAKRGGRNQVVAG